METRAAGVTLGRTAMAATAATAEATLRGYQSFVVRPVDATDNPEEIGPVDFVLFAVKLWDVEPAGIACRPMIGPETAVVSLQNGVDCEGHPGRRQRLRSARTLSPYPRSVPA